MMKRKREREREREKEREREREKEKGMLFICLFVLFRLFDSTLTQLLLLFN